MDSGKLASYNNQSLHNYWKKLIKKFSMKKNSSPSSDGEQIRKHTYEKNMHIIHMKRTTNPPWPPKRSGKRLPGRSTQPTVLLTCWRRSCHGNHFVKITEPNWFISCYSKKSPNEIYIYSAHTYLGFIDGTPVQVIGIIL